MTKLQGGHSNQLFQYATGKALALRLGVDLVMDAQWFGAIAESDTRRVYELGGYRLEQRFYTEPRRSWWRRASTLAPYRQQGHGFDPRVLELPDNSYLEGWWQDERYFRGIRETLLRELELRQPAKGRNAEWLRQIRDGVSVSVHVRRGDYVTNQAAREFHGLLDIAYYEAALERIHEVAGEDALNVFVFSDDIAWCERHLDFPEPTTFVDSDNPGAEDMRLMRHCRHHVIANSSFSWWGAWLSEDRGKVVVAPKNWFSDPQANAETEIVPKSWVRL